MIKIGQVIMMIKKYLEQEKFQQKDIEDLFDMLLAKSTEFLK